MFISKIFLKFLKMLKKKKKNLKTKKYSLFFKIFPFKICVNTFKILKNLKKKKNY